MTPFLRWAGGKRWLSERLAPLIRSHLSGTYIEPFLGGGAMFFSLQPTHAILSDINKDLINAFRMVAKDSTSIKTRLQAIPVSSHSYYSYRDSRPKDNLSKAVRFIFLNRTCYGGIHRTNCRGVFNTPYGGGSRTPEILWKRNLLDEAASLLRAKGIVITDSDFERSIDAARDGDVVYCDPVYVTKDRARFDRYNSKLFGWCDQMRLRDAVYRAYNRGALIVISNTYCSDVERLYSDAFRIPIHRPNAMRGSGTAQEPALEYVIILDPMERRSAWTGLGLLEKRRGCDSRSPRIRNAAKERAA